MIATVLLIAFSIALGAVVMSWGETYIEQKAEFVQGYQETVSTCDSVSFEVIKIREVLQVCTRGNNIEVLVGNGPAVEIKDFSARLIGSGGAKVVESVMLQSLLPDAVDKIIVANPGVGVLSQLKLTPKIMVGEKTIACPKASVVIEEFRQC